MSYYCEGCAADMKCDGHWDHDGNDKVMDARQSYSTEEEGGHYYACEECGEYSLTDLWNIYDSMRLAGLPLVYTAQHKPK